MTDDYAVYTGEDSEPDAVLMPQQWQVLVEYNNLSTTGPSTFVYLVEQDFETRAEALQEAERQAFEYEPPDPKVPQGREVYADGEGFLTVVAGMFTAFHFNTRVVRRLTGTTEVDDTAPVADREFLARAAEDGAVI